MRKGNYNIPWIFAELTVAINIDWCLDTSRDSVGVSLTALAWLSMLLLANWSSAAHLLWSTLLRDLIELTLIERKLSEKKEHIKSILK